MTKPKSVVVLSGGQDSATALFEAKTCTDVVAAIHFQYGQRHSIESRCASEIAAIAGVRLFTTNVPSLKDIGHSALLQETGSDDVNARHPALKELPASFVPGRNIVFLSLATAFAMSCGATHVWTGVCETDYSGYPDCREDTIRSLEKTLRLGMNFPDLDIVTPLMRLSKAQTFAVAKELGVLDLIIEQTHTCYEGERETRHDWGYGCGKCGACAVRARGWEEYVGTDTP